MHSKMDHSPFTMESHNDHDRQWLLVHPSLPEHCLACIVEFLENEERTVLKKRHALAVLLEFLHLSAAQLRQQLQLQPIITQHIALLFLGFCKQDKSIVELSVRALDQLLFLMQNDELTCCVLEQIANQVQLLDGTENQSGAYLELLSCLVSKDEHLGFHLVQNFGTLVEFVLESLASSDLGAQVKASSLCVQLYSGRRNRLLLPLVRAVRLASTVMQTLQVACDSQLILSFLNLLNLLLEDMHVADALTTQNRTSDQISLHSVIKKVLLSRMACSVKVVAVHCLHTALAHDVTSALAVHTALTADMAEILFQTLITANDSLIEAILSCLQQFAKFDAFFNKSQAVYGVEAVVRTLEYLAKKQNIKLQLQAVSLLDQFLSRHEGSVRLFLTGALWEQTMQLFCETISRHKHQVALRAAQTFHTLIRKRHLSSVPLGHLSRCLQILVERLQSLNSFLPQPHPATTQSSQVGSQTSSGVASGSTMPGMTSASQDVALSWFHCLLLVLRELFGVLELVKAGKVLPASVYTAPSLPTTRKGSQSEAGAADNRSSSSKALIGQPSSSEFALCLVKVTVQICVPQLMKNETLAATEEVVCLFYDVIGLSLDTCSPDVRSEALKFLHTHGMLAHALAVKARFRDTTSGFARTVEPLLVSILMHVAWRNRVTEIQTLKLLYQEGVQQIAGGVDQLLTAMSMPRSELGVDCHVSATQITALGALYALTKLGFDWLDHYTDSLEVFILQVDKAQSNAEKWIYQLVDIVAWISTKDIILKDRALQHMVETLHSVSPTLWTCQQIQLLPCIFGDARVSLVLGGDFLQYVLLDKDINEKDPEVRDGVKACMLELVQVSSSFARSFVGLLGVDNSELLGAVTSFLQSVFQPELWEQVQNDIRILIYEGVSDITHKLFFQAEKHGCRIRAVLDVVTDVQLRLCEPSPGATGSKIVFHVVELLPDCVEAHPEAARVYLRYLCSSLRQPSGSLDSDAVANLLPSNERFLEALEFVITGDSPAGCSTFLELQYLATLILTLLLRQAAHMQVSRTVAVSSHVFLRLVHEPFNGPKIRLGLLFWNTWLQHCLNQVGIEPISEVPLLRLTACRNRQCIQSRVETKVHLTTSSRHTDSTTQGCDEDIGRDRNGSHSQGSGDSSSAGAERFSGIGDDNGIPEVAGLTYEEVWRLFHMCLNCVVADDVTVKDSAISVMELIFKVAHDHSVCRKHLENEFWSEFLLRILLNTRETVDQQRTLMRICNMMCRYGMRSLDIHAGSVGDFLSAMMGHYDEVTEELKPLLLSTTRLLLCVYKERLDQKVANSLRVLLSQHSAVLPSAPGPGVDQEAAFSAGERNLLSDSLLHRILRLL